MTRDDIIEAASKAGFETKRDMVFVDMWEITPTLTRFANLVRTHLISEGWRQCAQGQKTSQFCGMVEQEREVCAREAGLILQGFRVEWPIIEEVIRAIRARGTQDPKVTHLNEWARDRLARHGISMPGDDDGNPSF